MLTLIDAAGAIFLLAYMMVNVYNTYKYVGHLKRSSMFALPMFIIPSLSQFDMFTSTDDAIRIFIRDQRTSTFSLLLTYVLAAYYAFEYGVYATCVMAAIAGTYNKFHWEIMKHHLSKYYEIPRSFSNQFVRNLLYTDADIL